MNHSVHLYLNHSYLASLETREISYLCNINKYYKGEDTPRSLLNCMPCMLKRAHVPTCFVCLRDHVPKCLAYLTCSRDNVLYVLYVLTCQRVLRTLLMCQCTFVLTCSCANVPFALTGNLLCVLT